MLITKSGQLYDFEKWPKWRQLDTSIELLVLDSESVLAYQREGGSLYLFMEGGTVHERSTEQSTDVGLLVLAWTGVNAETFGAEAGSPHQADMAHLTGSVPTLLQIGPGDYEYRLDRFSFEVEARYSGGADLHHPLVWGFTATQMTAYWKEL